MQILTNEEFLKLDYKKVEIERLMLLDQFRENPSNLMAAKMFYAKNPAAFINDWMVTFNTQAADPTMPFVLFPRQYELLDFIQGCYVDREDGLVEKCREVGLSWIAVAWAVHLWLFVPGKTIGFGSLKAEAVDKLGDMDSLLQKVRFALERLPIEFMPKGFVMDKHATLMHIRNPENNSMIKGDAGENIGRSGRASIYFIDEAAHLGNAKSIESSLAGTTECRIYISTPRGIGNMFYRKAHSATGSPRKFTFRWQHDPRKNDAWLEKKRKQFDPEIFAQEFLIDYAASLSGTCIRKEWIDACINLKLPATGKRILGVDYADEGKDKHSMVGRHGPVVNLIRSRHEGTTTEWTREVYQYCKENNVDVINYDSIGVGAGGKGEFKSIGKADATSTYKPTINGISTAVPPTKGFYAEGKKNEDMFLNLRAQAWWLFRDRCRKTYEYVINGEQHDVEELVSLPDNQSLIEQLCQPLAEYNENGKIKIESKKDMKKRGLKSPNEADALMLSFIPVSKRQITLTILGGTPKK